MMRSSVLSLCIAAAMARPISAQEPARPNVVLIMTDDMGYGDLGVTGAPDIRTPNLDRLAKQGVRFTNFYSNGPLCTPTRAALISGRYQQRASLERALSGARSADSTSGLQARGTSLPQRLKDHGYATGLVGKWHLGYRPEYSPRTHGFDVFWGIKSGYVDYYAHTAGNGAPDLFDGDTPVTMDGYLTDLITERALGFVRAHRDRPFFLEVAYSEPHWPYQPPNKPSRARDNARHLDARDTEPGTRTDYAAMVEHADRGIGQLITLLDSLRLASNTLVIFTNDNGGEWLSRNAPFRHRKWTLWEGGIRVPTILRWPGRLPAGRVTPQVGITMDLSATIVAATGSPARADAGYDGINLLPLVGPKATPQPRTLFWRTRAGNLDQSAVRDGPWKLLVDGPAALLFNLEEDPGETVDQAARHTDIVRRLAQRLAEWQQSVDADARARAPR